MLVSSFLNMQYLFRSKGCLSTEWEIFNLVVRVRPAWKTHRQGSRCTQVLSILDVAVRFDVSPLVQFAVLWLVEFWQILGQWCTQWESLYFYTATSDSSDFLVHVWYGNPAIGELWFIMVYPGVLYAQDGFHSGNFFGFQFSERCVQLLPYSSIGQP